MSLAQDYVPLKQLGNGVTTVFTGTWNMISNAFARVYLEDTTTGVQTLQTETTHYTITYSSAGFTITFLTPPPSTKYVVVGRNVSQTQDVPYKTSKGFRGANIEASFDKLTAVVQEIQDQVNRGLKFPLGSTKVGVLGEAPVDGRALIWNGTGGAVENGPTADEIENAQGYATAAQTAKTGAETAQAAAETAKTGAETAQTGAQTAKTGAETAQTGAQTAQAAAETARDAAQAAAAPATTLIQRSTGITELFTNPNVFHDGVYAQAVALTAGGSSTTTLSTTCFSNSACVVTARTSPTGRAGMRIAGSGGTGTLVVAQAISAFGATAGGKVSLSCRLFARVGTNTSTQVQVRQYSGGGYGTEISGARQTYNVNPATLAADVAIAFRNITLDASCTNVGFAFTSINGDSFDITDICMRKGEVSDFSPYLKDVASAATLAALTTTVTNAATTTTALASRVEGFTEMFTDPNLYRDARYTNQIAASGARTANNDLFAKTASGTITATTVDGRPAFAVSSAASGEQSFTWRNSLQRLGLTTSDKVSATCKITNRVGTNTAATRVLLRQFSNTTGTEISGARQTQLVTAAPLSSDMIVKFENITIDPACVEIGLYWSTGTTGDSYTVYDVCFARGAVGDFRPHWVDFVFAPTNAVQYIAPTGSDSAAGTLASPKLTLTAAKNALPNKMGTIVCRGGDYAYASGNSLSLSDTPWLRVVAANNEIPQFFFGEKILGAAFSAVGGATPNVFSTTMAVANGTNLNFVFDHGVAFGTISTDERHPLHRGRTTRCDSRPYWVAASLAECNSNAGSCFVSGTTLYLNPVGGSMTGKTIYVPHYAAIVSGGVADVNNYFEMVGITDRYAEEGPNLTNTAYHRLIDCISVGGKTNGFRLDYSCGQTIRCEAWGTRDGFNIHQTTALDPAFGAGQYLHIGTYGHDNWDDGMSHHERCEFDEFHGLFEYNGGTGCIPANGAHGVSTNSIARRNGTALGLLKADSSIIGTGPATGKGAGFGVTNAAGANEGGLSTDYTLFGCTTENNYRGLYANADANNIIHAYRCRLGTADAAYAKAMAANNAKLYLHDCTEYGTGTTKSTATGGTITVENSTLIT